MEMRLYLFDLKQLQIKIHVSQAAEVRVPAVCCMLYMTAPESFM